MLFTLETLSELPSGPRYDKLDSTTLIEFSEPDEVATMKKIARLDLEENNASVQCMTIGIEPELLFLLTHSDKVRRFDISHELTLY